MVWPRGGQKWGTGGRNGFCKRQKPNPPHPDLSKGLALGYSGRQDRGQGAVAWLLEEEYPQVPQLTPSDCQDASHGLGQTCSSSAPSSRLPSKHVAA